MLLRAGFPRLLQTPAAGPGPSYISPAAGRRLPSVAAENRRPPPPAAVQTARLLANGLADYAPPLPRWPGCAHRTAGPAPRDRVLPSKWPAGSPCPDFPVISLMVLA